MKIKKINKKLYYCKCINFGDELNKHLFEKVFNVQFNYCYDSWLADYFAIGSVLGNCSNRKLLSLLDKIDYIIKLIKGRINTSKITVLGSGFIKWSMNHKIKYLRRMDFKIVRGKLTENYLKAKNLLKTNVLLGDLGLLCPYMITCTETKKKYKLGIIPHYMDLESPVIYDIYKKYGKDCTIINVQDQVEIVIKQLTECENIISSSLHGLIAADSYCIPNIWFENTLRYSKLEDRELERFKYKDYYSSIGIDNIEPINILDFMDINIENIKKMYRVKKETIEKKQKELYDFCNEYFENI